MGYCITYDSAKKYGKKTRSSKIRVFLITAFMLVLFLFCVKLYWPEGARALEVLSQSLRWQHGSAMLEVLAGDLQSGVPLKEAVTAFCREIVRHGMEYAA